MQQMQQMPQMMSQGYQGNVGPVNQGQAQGQSDQQLPPMPSAARPENPCSPPMDYTNPPQSGGASNKTLVLYYAPWCSFCKKLLPVWDELANRYGERMQKVDCDAYPAEAEKQNIEAFPTIVLFVDGKKARVIKGGTDPETLENMLGQ